MRTAPGRFVLTLAVWLVPLAVVSACNVPVFRYALERWRPDAYEVVIFHRGPLSPEVEQLVNQLREASGDRKQPANVEVEVVDVDGKLDKRTKKLLDAQGDVELPLMVVRYPQQAGVDKPLWTGKPSADVVKSLLTSPARRELAKRLLAGQSAVWLLVESGDAAKDAAAAQLIEKEIVALQKSLKLPEDLEPEEAKAAKQGEKPQDFNLLSALPLEIKFSLLRVSRKDEAEKLFLAMLLGGETSDEPVMFPLFGRGRALEKFVGKEISGDVMLDVARFLTGPCSCTVKQLNPGVDLLFAVDWEVILEDRNVVPEPPVKPGVSVAIPQPTPPAPQPTAETQVPAPTAGKPAVTAEAAPTAARSHASRYLWLGVVLAGFTALLAGAAILTSRNKPGASAS
ncbi:MAG: hypothetical protein JNM56_11290 [Planctomycetia bacterium]|nr:hypothetical protein [Planctomycetia bacterium]